MKIVFFGTPQFAVPTLQSLIENPDFDVVAVVTQPDKRRGRGSKTIPSPVKKIALEHNIQVWQPKRVKKSQETLNSLRETQADAFVVVAYGQILSSEILQMPKLGCINVHGSILPQYRGAAPIQWSIYNGDRKTGITTMLMDEGLDTGDMLLKAETEIDLLDNAIDIAIKLSSQGANLLIETLQKLAAGNITPIPQEDSQATYARLIDKSDYLIDWIKNSTAIHNQIRGFYPNCYTSFRGKQLKIKASIPLIPELLSNTTNQAQHLSITETQWSELLSKTGDCGEIVYIIKNLGAVVQTGEGKLLLTEVQLSGKRTQSGWDFVNGMRISVGEKVI